MFFEQYPPGGLEPIRSRGPTPFRIPCAQVLGEGHDAQLVEIAKDIMPTIALHLMRRPAGSRVDIARTTTNNIYAVISGQACFSAEGGLTETLGPGDVIAVPCWHEHAVDAPQDTIILRVSDEPLLAKLGLAKTAAH
jgi:gentisate 1,2-dioxygenase